MWGHNLKINQKFSINFMTLIDVFLSIYYLGVLILFFDFKIKNNKRALTIKTIIINKLK